MGLDTLTLDQLTDLLVAFAKNLLPEDDYSRGSDNWKRVRILAGSGTDLSAMILSVEKEFWAVTASESTLENRHGVKLQLPRKGPIKASGALSGKIVGTVASTWLATNALIHTNGQRYYPTAGGTIGSGGEELVGVIADVGGLAGNLDAGEILTWELGAPTGLENEVELQVALTLGSDKESVGAYRTRVMNREAQPAMGGNANDWEQWILESSDDIAKGYVWPHRNGQGSVDIAGLKAGTGATRLLDGTERAALLAAVNLLRPVSTGSARVLEVTTEAQDVEATLVPESASEFAKDWNDSTPPVVSTWAASTRTLTFASTRPASMSVGHRLTVEGTSGVELEIESLSGTSAVILVSAKGQTPVNPSEVYSGGPIVTPVREAILALFDALGPRVTEFGNGKWVSSLYLSHLFETVQTADGVLDSTIVGPVADAEPTLTSYPSDDTVNLLIAGDVLVRYE